MNRFFLPEIQPAMDEVISLAPLHRQLRKVLRVQVGTHLVLLDNQGHERQLEVVTVDRKDTTARVVEIRPAPPAPLVAVTLYQSILKSDKFDWVLQKATELGVTTIVPLLTNRTVVRPSKGLDAKLVRWQSIVREAAEQSGRGTLPVVMPACLLAEAVTKAEGVRLLPWEEALGDPGLLAALGQTPQAVEAVSILIGPEGGLEAGEVEAAISAGWQVVSLGSRTLRAETAALAALSVVAAALGELGDAPTVKLPSIKKDEKGAKARKRVETKDEPESAKALAKSPIEQVIVEHKVGPTGEPSPKAAV